MSILPSNAGIPWEYVNQVCRDKSGVKLVPVAGEFVSEVEEGWYDIQAAQRG